VDNGYIVYTASSEDMEADKALFKAEGQALEDLANECSLIPLGTRIEDRYTKKYPATNISYIKIALEFQDCEKAKSAQDPESIRRIANVPFTEQLKKYQYFMENGDFAPQTEVADFSIPAEPPSWQEPVPSAHPSTPSEYLALRQYVAYQKEVLILSPATSYTPGSPEATKLQNSLISKAQQVAQIQQQNPQVIRSNQTWSSTPNRPPVSRPPILIHSRPGTPGRPLRPRGLPSRTLPKPSRKVPSGHPATSSQSKKVL
jgi:hypothetical protein